MQPQGYALITGASSGIGEEFARQLAAQGWSLILVARSQDRLEKVRSELMSAHMGIDVVAIPLDLTVSGAPADLFQRTQATHLEVDLLINNAGFGAFAEFASLDLDRVRQMLDLNIVALVELTHLYLQPMMQRRRGGIMNIASVAGFAPLPYSTVYAATKAFVKSFSDALYEEARRRGVHVMAVNPGTTETNFFRVAGASPFSHRARMQTSAEVVRESLRAFERKKSSVVTGASNRLLTVILTLLPRRWITSVVGKAMRRANIGVPEKDQ
ncbi:MAG TPA: SDR family oxidoreductase [Acidobacteriaceae bacterium]|nr:SDR family oxidoreductase [Acidobacteriaceae bacterium]